MPRLLSPGSAARSARKTARKTTSRGRAAATSIGRKPGVRELSAQATRDSLLRAAIKVFARHGFDGGSVEQISSTARSHDRMIYYYFGSKEGLFIAVIEEIYRRFDEAESSLEIDMGDPVRALREMTRFVWNYYNRHPEFIALLNEENLHRAKHISKARRAGEYSSSAISLLDRILAAGIERGVFRTGLHARDVYLMIAGLGYFYLSNRHTLSVFLGERLEAPEALQHWEGFIIEAVLRQVSGMQPAAGPETL